MKRIPVIVLGYFLLLFLVVLGETGQAASAGPSAWKQRRAVITGSPRAKLTRQDLVQLSGRLRRLLPAKNASLSKRGESPLREFFRRGNRKPVDLRTAVSRALRLQNWEVLMDEKKGVPYFLQFRGDRSRFRKARKVSAAQAAADFLARNRDLFRLENPGRELEVKDEQADRFGWKHVRFQQKYRGMPVWGGEIIAHLDDTGLLYALNARYLPTPKNVDLRNVEITQEQAIAWALQDLGLRRTDLRLEAWQKRLLKYDGPTARLYIWQDEKVGVPEPRLVWHVAVRPNFQDNWFVFVDAHTGEVLERYNATAFDGPVTATGVDLNGKTQTLQVYLYNGTYYMIDATRPIWQAQQPDLLNNPKGALVTLDVRGNDLGSKTTVYHVTSSDNSWSDPVSVSAHFNMGKVFEYYYNKFGRRAIDGKGSSIFSVIHVTDQGQGMDNAYWNGVAMAYGDGNVMFKPLAGALDVAAHEMTHGVIDHTVSLEYKFQSGALNESLADVFGAMVDNDDWTLGEEIIKPGHFPGGALRNMADPHNGAAQGQDGWQPATMSEFMNLDIGTDNGGVHINSGIPNHACYLIAQAIGREKTEKIYYRTMEAKYLTAQSQFIDMRLALIRAAQDFVQKGEMTQNDVDAVKAAFDQVGITGNQGTPAPQDVPPVQGEEWIAAINAENSDNSLYILRPVIQSNSDIVQLSSTQVYTRTGNPITVSVDGSVLLFIDQSNYIRAITGQGESVISNNGIWNSIALSPDATLLAATTVYEDSLLYIFNLQDPNQSKVIHLYTPTTDGARSNTVLYADAMDWNLTGEYLLFDAFNSIPQVTGDSLNFWNINILDVKNELIYPVFPPQPEGISVGNPSFSEVNDSYIVFDYYDANKMEDVILTYDIFNSQIGVIESNGASISYARYSTDDKYLIFERQDFYGRTNLRMIALQDNKIQPASTSVEYATGGMRPYWFAIGNRTPVEESPAPHLPERFSVSPNYPNPFNPETTIRFALPFRAEVTVDILDLQGRLVAPLLSAAKPAGSHTVLWRGRSGQGTEMPSGVYFYRVVARSPEGRVYRAVRKMTLLR